MSLSESPIAKQNYTFRLLKNETDLKKKGKNVQNTALKHSYWLFNRLPCRKQLNRRSRY